MEEIKNLQPLIDGDLLVHEISVLGEYIDEETQEPRVRHFSYLEEIVVNRIDEICQAVNSTLPPVIYLTGKGNFRYDIAKLKPYKGNRKSEKPLHFENVKWFLISRYNAIIVDGMEADDALGIEQSNTLSDLGGEFPYCPTVICSRDKDLRQIPGWHYGWEVGLQPEFRLQLVDKLGKLYSTWKISISEKTGKELRSLKKVWGSGMRWFYAQCLIGDTVDNIPGLPGCGPAKALEVLEECETEKDMFLAVKGLYQDKYGDEWEPQLLEQARLVWMVRELNKDGTPKMWELPE